MPRASTRSAASRMRSSAPSGSTTCADASRARSTRSCSNIRGVTAPSAAGVPSPTTAPRSPASSTSATAALTLRSDVTVIRPSTEPRAVAVAMVPPSVATTGSRMPSPATSRSTCGESAKPPLRTTPESEGSVVDWWASSTPRSTSSRSPGTMTTPSSTSRSMTWGIDMAATTRPEHSRSSSAASPWTRVPSHAAMRSPTVGERSSGTSGRAHAGTTPSRSWRAAVTARAASSGTWLTTTPATCACS